ncbi:MAG TPA: pilus assembly protein [Aestuariivirga sp.]|nr:pilus assembly protein [Aestuariivirga sp.]
MTMIRSLTRYLRNSQGMAAIEFALIMPLLMLLFFGMVDLTGLISTNRKVTYASGVMADLVTQSKTTVYRTSDIDDYLQAVYMIMKPVASGDVGVAVYGLTKTLNATGTEVITVSTWKTAGVSCGSAPTGAGLAGLMGSGTVVSNFNDLVIARVCTTFTPYVGTLFGKKVLGKSSFTLLEDTVQRPRASTKLKCQISPSNSNPC